MTRVGLMGAGLIGREHADLLVSNRRAEIAAICDPSSAAAELAARLSVPYFADYDTMLDEAKPDGAIIALPNNLHTPAALACIERGVPCMIEKPIAESIASAAASSRRPNVAAWPCLSAISAATAPTSVPPNAPSTPESSDRWSPSTA